MIAKTFQDLAEVLKNGSITKGHVIGLAVEGSEHGREDMQLAAELAAKQGVRVVLIEGDDPHAEMERMLDMGEIDGAVTMHYPFPIGVSTVGKVVTPAKGRPMYIATTTGTSDTDRICAMIKNAIYGIAVAKAEGISRPSVGIANIDGARQCEKALLRLAENGYDICFAESNRAEGGIVMRGNDLLQGSADVMVMDSLTGNLMIKIFSSYTTGGGYESIGWGYGPGVGEGFDKLILIISRASGAPLIAGACTFAADLLQGDLMRLAADELAAAKKAGLNDILSEIGKTKAAEKEQDVEVPVAEVVTSQIPGIEVMDLEDAVRELWRAGIYAESGMGCTGPIILISEANHDKAIGILTEKGFI